MQHCNGNRARTTRDDGTVLYTLFPDYEVEDPITGSTTIRTTYRLAGRIVAVRDRPGSAAGTLYYAYTDHLGNVAGLSQGAASLPARWPATNPTVATALSGASPGIG